MRVLYKLSGLQVLTIREGGLEQLIPRLEVLDEDLEYVIFSVSQAVGPVEHGYAGELWLKVQLW